MPLEAVAARCRKVGAALVVDATQLGYGVDIPAPISNMGFKTEVTVLTQFIILLLFSGVAPSWG